MKQTLLITTLLAAGTLGAMGVARLDMVGTGDESAYLKKLDESSSNWNYVSRIEYKYGAVIDGGWHSNSNSVYMDGSHHRTNLENYGSSPMTINLNADARYEFSFRFNLSQSGNGYDLAMAGMYLSGNNGALYFGNTNIVKDGNYDKGTALVLQYAGDIAEYNDVANPAIHFPNHELNAIGAPSTYVAPIANRQWTVYDNNGFASGNYKLEIVIEAFADDSVEDMVYFYASTPSGTKWVSGEAWNMEALGFSDNESFDTVGFLLHDDNSSNATPISLMASEYSRVKRSTTPTEPEVPPVVPDIPEPSAFGLLAGIGGLALVAARRRRSRS